jgi:hypothetical protein
MKEIRLKAPQLQPAPVSYEALRQQILRRDGWRCQSCGTMEHLEVHHREFRSHSGDDSELNLSRSVPLATVRRTGRNQLNCCGRKTLTAGLCQIPQAIFDCVYDYIWL